MTLRLPSTAMCAAEYFDIHDLPRRSVSIGVGEAIVVTDDYVYIYSDRQPGMSFRLTDNRRTALIAALAKDPS